MKKHRHRFDRDGLCSGCGITKDEYIEIGELEMSMYEQELADARAEIAVLREALKQHRRDDGCFGGRCDRDWHSFACHAAKAALSSPSEAAEAWEREIRTKALEQAATVVEDTDIETYGGYHHEDDARSTLRNAAAAIRALIGGAT